MLSFVTAFCFQEARPGTQRQLDECQMFAAKAPNPRCSCSEYRRSIAQESTVCRCRVSPTTDQRRLSREQSDCSKATSDPTVNLRNLIRCTTNLVMQKVCHKLTSKSRDAVHPKQSTLDWRIRSLVVYVHFRLKSLSFPSLVPAQSFRDTGSHCRYFALHMLRHLLAPQSVLIWALGLLDMANSVLGHGIRLVGFLAQGVFPKLAIAPRRSAVLIFR